MRYVKMFEQFAEDSESDRLIHTAKMCLDGLKYKIVYKELFEHDLNAWFLVIFSNKAPISKKDFRMLSEKYRIKIKDLDDDVIDRFFKEQKETWLGAKKLDEVVLEFSQWWGWHYDDIYNLGIYESIKPNDPFEGNIFYGDTADGYEEDTIFYVEWLSPSDDWNPVWIDM